MSMEKNWWHRANLSGSITPLAWDNVLADYVAFLTDYIMLWLYKAPQLEKNAQNSQFLGDDNCFTIKGFVLLFPDSVLMTQQRKN